LLMGCSGTPDQGRGFTDTETALGNFWGKQ